MSARIQASWKGARGCDIKSCNTEAKQHHNGYPTSHTPLVAPATDTHVLWQYLLRAVVLPFLQMCDVMHADAFCKGAKVRTL